MPERPQEVQLHGGTANRGLVVRVADTVRRPVRPTSAATRALLQHLDEVGFGGAPRFLGVDAQGREVLTYVEGEAVTPPYPAWAMTGEALSSVAVLLRRYHEAVAGFEPSGHSWPRAVPEHFRSSLVTHNDPNLDNVVFRDHRAVALIDFDLAGPGSPVWDVAAAARLWSPLRPEAEVDDVRRGESLRRLRTFVDAYGLGDEERGRLPEAVLANHDWCYGIVAEEASHGHAAFAQYWQAGAAERAARTRDWYEQAAELIRAVVL